MIKTKFLFHNLVYLRTPFIAPSRPPHPKNETVVQIVGDHYQLLRHPIRRSRCTIDLILTNPSGYVKEMWRPYLSELMAAMAPMSPDVTIENIVTLDMRNQGDSAALNQGTLLEGPFKWRYNTQDIIAVLQHLNFIPDPDQYHTSSDDDHSRGAPPVRPPTRQLVGIGNSIGASSLLHVEATRPGTLHGIIGMDPGIFFPLSAHTRALIRSFQGFNRHIDTWPTRAHAIAHFAKRRFYQGWDPRVLHEYQEHGLCYAGGPSLEEVRLKCSPREEKKTVMDDFPFQEELYHLLPRVKCPVQILLGDDGPRTIMMGDHLATITSQLDQPTMFTVIPGGDHLLSFEAPRLSAEASAQFLVHLSGTAAHTRHKSLPLKSSSHSSLPK